MNSRVTCAKCKDMMETGSGEAEYTNERWVHRTCPRDQRPCSVCDQMPSQCCCPEETPAPTLSIEGREEFEKWALGYDDECDTKRLKDGSYYNDEMNDLWRAWQASRASDRERVKELEATIVSRDAQAAEYNAIAHRAMDRRDATESRVAELQRAIEALYFAANWHPDREVDAAKLWTDVRDAAGIVPGQTAERVGKDRGCARLSELTGLLNSQEFSTDDLEAALEYITESPKDAARDMARMVAKLQRLRAHLEISQ